MALDADTTTKLAALQDQLTSQQQVLKAQVVYLENLKQTLGQSGLSMDELLAMKETVFNDLPEAENVQRDLERVSIALSGIAKLLPVPAPVPAPTPAPSPLPTV